MTVAGEMTPNIAFWLLTIRTNSHLSRLLAYHGYSLIQFGTRLSEIDHDKKGLQIGFGQIKLNLSSL